MIDTVLELIAPHSCCGCGYHGTLLCQVCKYDITSDPFARCIVCMKPASQDNLCAVCRNETPYAAAWCVGERTGSLKELLDRYKFDSARRGGYEATALLDIRLPLLADEVTVVPVPTSQSHKRVRGFDHTHLLAKRFAKLRGLVYSPVLARDDAGTQHFLSRTERLNAAQKGLRVRQYVPEVVLLIDDIYTTGATVRACANVLRVNGAKKVLVAVVARQTLDEDADL